MDHFKLQPAAASLTAVHSTCESTTASQLPGGKYDNLSPGWSDPDFYSGVPIFSQFTSQKLIQLSFEDTISDKLKNKQTKSSSIQVLNLNTRFSHSEFGCNPPCTLTVSPHKERKQQWREIKASLLKFPETIHF